MILLTKNSKLYILGYAFLFLMLKIILNNNFCNILCLIMGKLYYYFKFEKCIIFIIKFFK